MTFYEYCQEYGLDALLKQWHPERNGELTPSDVSYGSHARIWWRCEKGHEWEASLFSRTCGQTGCPVCTNRKLLPEYNSLAVLHPELIPQWHPTKNGSLTPNDVLVGSKIKVWWICDKGHEWEARPSARASGSQCPICAHRIICPGINDLATTHPELAAQWHPTKNGTLTPTQIFSGSTRKVWWRCEKGHEWQASMFSRSAQQRGCPVCTGRQVVPGENDLASANPILASQWHPTKNSSLTPQQVTPYSNRKVWWICNKGHEWQTAISARSFSNSGCPYCSGRKVLPGFNDLATVVPEIADQWHPTLNGSLTPQMVTSGSKRKVWWQCSEGHVWTAVIYSRTGARKCGCPVCAGSANVRRRNRYAKMQTEDEFLQKARNARAW